MTTTLDATKPAAYAHATTLRAIARQLQAMYDVGDFGLCFEHVRADMASLPASLNDLADEIACLAPSQMPGSGY